MTAVQTSAANVRLVADLAENPAWLLDLPDDELRRLVAGLSPDERRALAEWLDRQSPWRANPATFANHLTGGRVRLWPYVRLLGQKFADAVEGRSTRQIWNMPARYGKSEIGCRWGPTWALDRDPTTKLILVSYADALVREHAVVVRDNLREHQLHADLRPDVQRADRFLTAQGGGLLAAGIMASITGFGAHGAVFDDPFKDWQEAHSEARRKLVDNQFRTVVTLRLETGASWLIVIQTRWHEDDLSGRLLKRMEDGTGEAWELVRIPALAERFDPDSMDPLLRIPDPLGRQPGEIIEPERFDAAAVAARHLALGSSYLIAALEQQRPSPEEGGEIRRAWFRLEPAMPERFDRVISSWDMKLKDTESGDYVVGQVWGSAGADCWCIDQLRGQWDQATTTNAIALAQVRHPQIRRHLIENTGNGPEVMKALRAAAPTYEVSDAMAGALAMTREERARVEAMRRRGLGGLVPNTPKGSKRVRARAVAGYIEAGDVHLPERAPWVPAFLDEMAAFPNGAHDDQVDAMSQALARLHGLGRNRRRPPVGEQLRNTRAQVI